MDTIANIANKISDKWCVSNSEKVPLDMFALRKGFEWGASNNREHSSYECYSDVEAFVAENPNQYKICSWLAADGEYAILDIESICPKEIRAKLLEMFKNDIIYLEMSMSNHGFHAIIPRKYEKTAKYKKYAEILVNHHCTYTGNQIDIQDAMNLDVETNLDMSDEDIEDIQNLTDVYDLFKKPSINVSQNGSADWQDYKTESQYLNGSHADLYNIMYNFEYPKTLEDFDMDYSRYEFGYASALNYLIQRTAPNMIDSDARLYDMHISKRSAALLIYFILKQKLQPRAKHDEFRNGLPWLLYTADKIVNN